MTKPKLVCGVGIYERGKYLCWENDAVTREYDVWASMLKRCYSNSIKIKQPTYSACIVSDNFKNFQYFAEWCNNQIGWDENNWQLDKDFAGLGNNLYSENTCHFVPMELNNFLTKRENHRGKSPIGVCFHKRVKKYQARCNIEGRREHLGYYETPEEAFMKYKYFKETYARALALKYENIVSDKVINILKNFTVEITD